MCVHCTETRFCCWTSLECLVIVIIIIVRAVQHRMLRTIIYLPRCPEKSAESHMVLWSRLIRNCRAKHKVLHGDVTYFARYFSWCGHIARITTRDLGRETIRMCMNKNRAWPRNLKKELGTQCRGRRLRVCTTMRFRVWDPQGNPGRRPKDRAKRAFALCAILN